MKNNDPGNWHSMCHRSILPWGKLLRLCCATMLTHLQGNCGYLRQMGRLIDVAGTMGRPL
jgi:hypothetical protein